MFKKRKKLKKRLSALLSAIMLSGQFTGTIALAAPIEDGAYSSAASDEEFFQKELMAQGGGTITGTGTGFNRAVQLANLAELNVSAIYFDASRWIESQTATNRQLSYFATLSNGAVVAFRTRSGSLDGGFDRLNFGIGGTTANATGGSDGDFAPFSANVFGTYGQTLRVGATVDAPNHYTIAIAVEGNVASGALTINGAPISTLNFSEYVPVGTTITGIYAFVHNNAIAIGHDWTLYGTSSSGVAEREPDAPVEPEPEPEIKTAPITEPENISASVGASGTVSLRWDAVSGATEYRIFQGALDSELLSATTETFYRITGLQNGEEYVFYVAAANAFGTGPAARITAIPLEAELHLNAGAWFESVYGTWIGQPGTAYDAFISPAGANEWVHVNRPGHEPLVRLVDEETLTWRVDVPALSAMSNERYDLRIVDSEGTEAIVANLAPEPFDRSGFAFSPQSPFGQTTGGHNSDGTVREDAHIIYVTAENINTFTTPFHGGTTGLYNRDQGLFHQNFARNRVNNSQALIEAAPLVIRFVGHIPRPEAVRTGNMIRISRTANITFEGVGPDAVIDGWGLNIFSSSNIVVRNLSFQNFPDDAINLEGSRGSGEWGTVAPPTTTGAPNRVGTNIWVHHNNFLDGNASSDGAVDAGNTSFFTIAHNYFYNNARVTNQGNIINTARFYSSFNNNWIVGANSRVPRLRNGLMHFYNNFIDGANAYAIGAGHQANMIAEGNYIRNANRPMIMSMQGAGVSGNNTLTGDSAGYLITSLTTPENHPNNPRGTEEIFTLAETLQPNIIRATPNLNFNPAVDQGLPTVDNPRQPAPFIYFNPRAMDMGINVLSAEQTMELVPQMAGAMRDGFVMPEIPEAPESPQRPQLPDPPQNPETTGPARIAEGEGAITGAGVGFNNAVRLADLSELGLRSIQLDAASFISHQTQNQRFISYFLTLSNGEVIAMRARALSDGVAHTAFDQLNFGLSAEAANATGGGAANSTAFSPNVFSAFNQALTPSPTADTANAYSIAVHISPEGELMAELTVNSVPIASTNVSAQVPAGTTVTGVYAWVHSNTITMNHQWSVYNTAPGAPVAAAVENLSAAVGISGMVALTWDRLPGAVEYVIYQGFVGSELLSVTTEASHQITGLQDGEEYVFYVVARNEFGSGPAARITAVPTEAALNLEAGAWRESIYGVWQGAPGESYRVYVSLTGENNWTLVNGLGHEPLARMIDETNNIWRADVLGLRALGGESYDLRVIAVGTGIEATVQNLAPQAFDRTGYAFSPQSRFGWTSGGYHADGTIREDAVIIYVTEENMNTFANPFNSNLGLAGLFPANGRAANSNGTIGSAPLIVRFMGSVGSGTVIDGLDIGRPLPGPLLEDGGNIPAGLRPSDRMLNVDNAFNITFEGVGPDAIIYGWGLRIHQSQNIEIRNLIFDMYWDDGVFLAGGNQNQNYQFDTPNGAHNLWVHHNEFRHGQNRSNEDSDLQFGDGALDHGDEATFFTIAYNRFAHADKAMLANGNNGRPFFRGSYHHNHFYHTNQRHPRVRTGMAHIFNNFFEGTGVQGIQAGDFSNIVAEGNYFENATNPFVISGQGHGLNANGSNRMGADNAGAIVTSDLAGRPGVPEWVSALMPNALNNPIGFNPELDLGFSAGPGQVPGALERNANGSLRHSHTFGHVGPSQTVLDMVPANFYEHTVFAAEIARERVLAYAGPISSFLPETAPPAVRYVEAIINSDRTFTVSWGENLLASNFEIEWNGEEIGIAGRARTFTTAQTATPGGEYAFRVRAVNANGTAPWSEPFTVAYVEPKAPTDLEITVNSQVGGLSLVWSAPIGGASGYIVTISQIADSDGNPVEEPNIITADAALPAFSVSELEPGTYRIEVQSRIGQLVSEGLEGTAHIDEFLIRTADLQWPVFEENFNGWAIGPIRDQARIDLLGLEIRANSGNVANPGDLNVGFPARLPASPDFNDALIVEHGRQGNGLLLLDRSQNNNEEAMRYGTHLNLDLPEEITAGRVMVEFDFNLQATMFSGGMTPIIIRDGGGRAIASYTANQLGLNNNQWYNVQLVLDLDARVMDFYIDGEIHEFGVPLAANITGLAQISGNTPRGNQSSNPNQELSIIYDNFSVRIEGAAPESPQAPEAQAPPAWTPEGIYDSGSRVYWQGRIFEAKWWTRNQAPNPSEPWGAWMEIGEEAEILDITVPRWTASRVFLAGDKVYYQGRLWQSQWWTRNQSPKALHGPWMPVEK